jgi:hypothetical protein
MHKSLLIFTAALALAGCSTTRDTVVVSSAPRAVVMDPQPVVRQAPVRVSSASQAQDDSTALLKPGPTYVAAFPEADRRAACERLNYRSGTQAYAKCLEGDFPENPYFAQAGN